MDQTYRTRSTLYLPYNNSQREVNQVYVTRQEVSVDVDCRFGLETVTQTMYTYEEAIDEIGVDGRIHAVVESKSMRKVTSSQASRLKSWIGPNYNEVCDTVLNATLLLEKSRVARLALNSRALENNPENAETLEFNSVRVS